MYFSVDIYRKESGLHYYRIWVIVIEKRYPLYEYLLRQKTGDFNE